jgi:cytochrome d ubiquinol oxidase subunit I
MKGRQVDVFRAAAKSGAWVVLVAAVIVSISGDLDAKIMVQQQPMKMAAAEALYETSSAAPFSVLSIGNVTGDSATALIQVPGLTSFMATGSFDGTVEGINNLQSQYQQQYGPGNYAPYVPVSYWGFRLMIGLGMLAALYALWALWRFRGGRTPKGKLFSVVSTFIVLGPLMGISAGWIFTEMGRQPWIVFGAQKTADAVSPLVTPLEVWISLIGFTLVYAALAVVEVILLLRYIKAGAPEDVNEDPFDDAKKDADKQLYFAY